MAVISHTDLVWIIELVEVKCYFWQKYLVLRLVTTELKKENTELKQRLKEYREQYGETSSNLGEASKHFEKDSRFKKLY